MLGRPNDRVSAYIYSSIYSNIAVYFSILYLFVSSNRGNYTHSFAHVRTFKHNQCAHGSQQYVQTNTHTHTIELLKKTDDDRTVCVALLSLHGVF